MKRKCPISSFQVLAQLEYTFRFIDRSIYLSTFLGPSLTLVDIFDDDSDDIFIDAKLNTWINESFGFFSTLGYMLDDGDISVSGGLVLGF